ncbi:MAG: type II secretion system protein [Chloroflexi bacterium]|nr:type II secretion system protein [Chloroflexota bacterium]
MLSLVRNLRGREKGGTLIEALAALGIMGFIAVAFISTLGTGAKATAIASEQTVAESLARSQIEYVRFLSYANSYPLSPELEANKPAGWNVYTTWVRPPGNEGDSDIQKVTVTVTRNDRTILSIDFFKVYR